MFSRPAPRLAFAVAALALSMAAAPAAAQLTPNSRLTFTGTANATDLGTPGVLLEFEPTVVAATSGNSGAFARLNGGASAPAVTGTIGNILVGQGPQPVTGLLTIGGYRFDLLALPSGTYGQADCYVAPARGQRCTPYQSVLGDPKPTDARSPFNLANVATGRPGAPLTAVASFNLIGTVTAPGGATADFFGTISSSFAGMSFQEVLGGLEFLGGNGLPYPGITFTGTFIVGTPGARLAAFDDEALYDEVAVAVTPEPGTVALVAGGLVGVAGMAGAARRRRS
jgi:hypothetical protein